MRVADRVRERFEHAAIGARGLQLKLGDRLADARSAARNSRRWSSTSSARGAACGSSSRRTFGSPAPDTDTANPATPTRGSRTPAALPVDLQEPLEVAGRVVPGERIPERIAAPPLVVDLLALGALRQRHRRQPAAIPLDHLRRLGQLGGCERRLGFYGISDTPRERVRRAGGIPGRMRTSPRAVGLVHDQALGIGER